MNLQGLMLIITQDYVPGYTYPLNEYKIPIKNAMWCRTDWHGRTGVFSLFHNGVSWSQEDYNMYNKYIIFPRFKNAHKPAL